MSTRWFIGDPHINHAKVAQLRGHPTVERHNMAFVKAWLTQVRPQDEVFVLGDLSSGKPEDEDHALEIFALLPGTKHLIAGNHDSVSSVHRRGWKRMREFLGVFDSVREHTSLRIAGQRVMLSHYPYASQRDGANREGPGRFMEHRLHDAGLPLLHAHTHSVFAFDPAYPNQMCVSWDAHHRLVSLRDIESWVSPVTLTRVGAQEMAGALE